MTAEDMRTALREGGKPIYDSDGDRTTPRVNAMGACIELGDMGFLVDTDADTVPDACDNCTLISNQDQRDTNGDGFGNRCDGDFNNDNIVNATDLGLMEAVFFASGDLDEDLDGDGMVNAVDLGILRTLFFEPPGPNGALP